jgi:hypothetical protein
MASKSTATPKVDAQLVGRVLKLRQAGKTWNEVREELAMPKLRGEHIRSWLKEHGREGEAARPPKPKPDAQEAPSSRRKRPAQGEHAPGAEGAQS